MVEVSAKFRELALANGRHVFCRITVGAEVFPDDRLLEFDFDDVTHPDWFTVGTACANRFHFRARFSGEIAVGEELRPYISFDGEEWCPLGVFYVSRRYVRGNVIGITAYDKLYSLDREYLYTGTIPTTSDVLLREICSAEGITLADGGHPYEVAQLPEVCTVRDMIGYIAGLNGACAKIDRSGNLVLRSPDFNGLTEHISHLNCMDIQRNMTRSVVTCLMAQTETELLVAGSGAEISTLEMYNPLMTEERLQQMYSQFRPFGFFGADVEMQGLPYLESGEAILLLDGAMAYPIIISEIEFHYNGALSAVLYSRNKTYVDAVVHEDDLEETIAQLKKQFATVSMKQVNEEQRVIGTQQITAAEFAFDAYSGGFAELHVNVSLTQSTADFVYFRIYVDGVEADRSIAHVPEDVSRTLVGVYHLEQNLTDGRHIITVTMQTGSGEAYILPKAMFAGLVVHGSGSGTGAVRDKVGISERFGFVTALPFSVMLPEMGESAAIQ